MGNCCTCIDQGYVGFVERCGKFDRVAQPGDVVAGKLSLRVQQLDVSCETKTKDNVFVTIVVSVQYQVVTESLYDAFYRTKEEIATDVKQELSKVMGMFGFEILQALVTDIDPAPRVKDAMNEINAAQRLSQDVNCTYWQWAVLDSESTEEDLEGVSNKEIMELLLLTQYFDMVKDVGAASKSSTLFMTHSPSAVNKVALELRSVLTGDRAALVNKPGLVQPMKR
eukprot:gene7739-7938_t